MKIRFNRSTVRFTAAAPFIYTVNAGIRNNFGMMLTAVSKHTGLAFASVSFVLAVGQLCFGVTQPFSGIAAERYGNRRTLLAGAIGTIAGAALLPLCAKPWAVMLALGVLPPGSLGIVSYGLLIGTISPHIPESRRPLISGVVNAGSGRDYQFLVAGFFTCGFHMALITSHLATEIMSYGFSYRQSSYAFSVCGIAAIAGAATVTPVSGLCRRLFGAGGVTVFYGIAFFAHQTGGLLSAWLGGMCFAQSGSYLRIWLADSLLCALAAAVSYLISAQKAEQPQF